MRTRILAVVVVAAAIFVGVLVLRGRDSGADGRIVISGNIELTEVNIAFKTAGKLIELAVREGDDVRKGMVLARLDAEQLSFQRDRERAGLQSAESQAAQLRTAIQWQRETVESDIAQRIAQLQESRARLEELTAGSRPQEIQQARAAVEAARTEFDRAQRDWQRAQTLYKNDDISTAQFDQFRSRFEAPDATLKQARERLALVEEGARKEDIAAARARVARAEAGVKTGEAQRLEIRRREQETDARRAEIARARAQIALIESQLADTVVASPIDGTVLVKAAEPGEILAPGATVVTVGDIEHPWMRGYIAETDLGRVKTGAKVRVRSDSFPGKDYWGKVTFISSEAEFTPKQIQTQQERVKLVYRIKVEIENPARELKKNMPVVGEL